MYIFIKVLMSAIPSSQENTNYEYSYKIIFLGDAGVGKSCLINRGIKNVFNEYYENTVSFEYLNKIIQVNNKGIKLQIWDTCGQEIFSSIVVNFYRNCDLAVLVYSLTSKSSLGNLNKWVEEVKKNVDDCKFILVGSKSDLQKDKEDEELLHCISEDDINQFMAQHNIAYHLKTSAKTGSNVNELFTQIGKILIEEAESLDTKRMLKSLVNSKDLIRERVSLIDKQGKNKVCCNGCC